MGEKIYTLGDDIDDEKLVVVESYGHNYVVMECLYGCEYKVKV